MIYIMIFHVIVRVVGPVLHVKQVLMIALVIHVKTRELVMIYTMIFHVIVQPVGPVLHAKFQWTPVYQTLVKILGYVLLLVQYTLVLVLVLTLVQIVKRI